MKIELNKTLTTLDGKELVEPTKEGNVSVRLKAVIINALLAPVEKDSGEAKLKKYQLAVKIHETKNVVDLTVEELSLIKERVGASYPPLIVGQTFKMLGGI